MLAKDSIDERRRCFARFAHCVLHEATTPWIRKIP